MTCELAHNNEMYNAAAKLFSEYAEWLGIDLSFQHFENELNGLEAMYSAPNGGIILCKENDQFIACVAVRRIDDTTAELKRMYVQPAYQGKGIASRLLENALQLAKDLGYSSVRLDTLDNMTPAIQLYKKYGFYEIPAYYHNPIGNAVYFEKLL